MPSKVRERDRDRDQDRDRDRDIDAPKSREKQRHRKRRSSTKDSEKMPANPERRTSRGSPSVKRTPSMPIPELDRPASNNSPFGSRSSLPYPSFSKAHSKEAVGSREDVVNPRYSYYTPDPTDLDRSKEQKGEMGNQNATGVAPPSPPLTTVEQGAKEEPVTASPLSDEMEGREVIAEGTKESSVETAQELEKPDSSTGEDLSKQLERNKKADLQNSTEEDEKKTKTEKSSISVQGKSRRPSRSKSKTDLQKLSGEAKSLLSSRKSKLNKPSKSELQPPLAENDISLNKTHNSTFEINSLIMDSETPSDSIIDSDATSVAPNQLNVQQPSVSIVGSQTPSVTYLESGSQTPSVLEPCSPPNQREASAFLTNGESGLPGPFDNSPAPPPPPPPPEMPFQMPRVDYLMQHGGLSQCIPRALLGAGQPVQFLQADPQLGSPTSAQVGRFFAPLNNLLDDYNKVISRNGSLAVATGYRSIARRLLDRLEVVFARDISSENCNCIICESSPLRDESAENEKGVNWGEILELVCGRQELPPWPPFVLDSAQAGLGISSIEQQPPMQNLDIDVPNEFRDHYIRQSKKTKLSVDKWLAKQLESPTNPPEDVDDETLTFAMLTRLVPEQRPVFSSLVGVIPSRPPSRVATPLIAPRSSLLENTGLAIQRLYSLSGPPRDPESAIYLLTNPSMHNVLATLAAISDGEWDILTSGRFDGFLRSGADDHSGPFPPPNQAPLSRGPSVASHTAPRTPFSRSVTPFSRGPTPSPASLGAPVALDEETEIAVLAEIEREIYLGMEALEDAFEALHCKAEAVRSALRERGAGLSMASERRRGSRDLDARLGTPSSANLYGSESEADDWVDDGISELAPDDSASNISRIRHRRPKRRTERRTPALPEADEGSE